MSTKAGTLYVVATPIGNLGDMTPRAVEVLRAAGHIAAEDTRHSAGLLHHFGIATPMIALHEHNERQRAQMLLERLLAGEDIALISDAGTPLISDPGYHLVRQTRAAGVKVVPVPGTSALIAALSVSGLPTDRFCFEGFLPAKSGARTARLELLRRETRTLAFYEAPHRIEETLADAVAVFGAAREAVMARELTKTWETLLAMPLGMLLERVKSDPDQRRGEIVLLIAGAELADETEEEARRVALLLAEELPVKQAASLAAKITGARKNALYDYLLKREE
ncbi:MAG TPA: 16S rRNA (cytidine(1402)-2'-O)-methyltransferase [Gammaproteobacteria bacterium]